MINGEEFVYSIDGAHAAVFSLPTMKFRLLADPSPGSQQSILGKTASSRGQAVAVMSYLNDTQWVVAVYEGADLAQRMTLAIPGARNFRFAPSGDSVLVAPTEPRAPLAVLNWRRGSYRNIGRYGDMALVDAVVTGPTAAVLGRRRSKDVWFYDGSRRRPLTTDGNNDDAAISPTGELLVAKSEAGSTETIWSRTADGAFRKVTNGPQDTSPDFSPDGTTWVYVDYARRSIMICKTGTDECRVLRRDEVLPTAPRFSPDGLKVAYVTMGAAPRVMAFAVSGGKEWPMGGTHWQCPPVWSSATRVWIFEGSAGGFGWVEKDLETGLRTGRRVHVKDDQSAVSDELEVLAQGRRCDVAIFP